MFNARGFSGDAISQYTQLFQVYKMIKNFYQQLDISNTYIQKNLSIEECSSIFCN